MAKRQPGDLYPIEKRPIRTLMLTMALAAFPAVLYALILWRHNVVHGDAPLLQPVLLGIGFAALNMGVTFLLWRDKLKTLRLGHLGGGRPRAKREQLLLSQINSYADKIRRQGGALPKARLNASCFPFFRYLLNGVAGIMPAGLS